MSFPRGRLRLESLRPPEDGQDANIVLWCPRGLRRRTSRWSGTSGRSASPACASSSSTRAGVQGEDLFDLAPRTGPYEQYHHGDLDAYHVSYFRRMWPSERKLHTCNLRKSYGFHLVAQGPDPLPAVLDAQGPYALRLTVHSGVITFAVGGPGVLPVAGRRTAVRRQARLPADGADDRRVRQPARHRA